jgi:hypothetical protein
MVDDNEEAEIARVALELRRAAELAQHNIDTYWPRFLRPLAVDCEGPTS